MERIDRREFLSYLKAVGAIAILGPLSGCVEPKEQKETTKVTDLAGREVRVKVPCERIVLASSRHLHEFAAVGGESVLDKIVGWGPDLKNYDQDTFLRYKESYPEIENIPQVGYHYQGTFSVETVLSLEPDVVVFPLWLEGQEAVGDDIERFENAGIPTVYIDYWKEPFNNPVDSTLLIGTLLGEDSRAQEVVGFYQERVNEIASRLENIQGARTTAYVEVGSKGPSEYGNTYGNYGWGAVINKAGGDNIAETVVEKAAPINPEYLLDKDPDVIIITGSYWTAEEEAMRLGYHVQPQESMEVLQAFIDRPGWESLSAVKETRVHSIFHGFSFRIYNFAGIQAFAKWFYPQEFQDIKPEESLKEFHERFLPVDYSGVWMISLPENGPS